MESGVTHNRCAEGSLDNACGIPATRGLRVRRRILQSTAIAVTCALGAPTSGGRGDPQLSQLPSQSPARRSARPAVRGQVEEPLTSIQRLDRFTDPCADKPVLLLQVIVVERFVVVEVELS